MGRTVLIVDDHVGFRRTARRLLEAEGFTVVGEAGDAAEALATAAQVSPQVVLLDVHLPDGNGFDVAARLATAAPGAQVILTSSRDASDYSTRLPGAAARGFIGKAELSGPRIAALLGGTQ
ncbi:MAG: response regulator [Frankiales bacterium]|jgi:DNA-binding NarL/FixJ family response regulator|nr:response regulator [Frankiales bacterium]